MITIVNNKILTKVGISKQNFPDSLREYTALWDTGSTETFISTRVASELNLKIVWTGTMTVADGREKTTNIYDCNILLPGHNQAVSNRVPSFDKRPECDVIIGMDIIKSGEFVIKNEKFSFEIKSAL